MTRTASDRHLQAEVTNCRAISAWRLPGIRKNPLLSAAVIFTLTARIGAAALLGRELLRSTSEISEAHPPPRDDRVRCRCRRLKDLHAP
jgi:hypothetical protein